MKNSKKIIGAIAAMAVVATTLAPVAQGRTRATEREANGAILHAWSWSFDTIAAHMGDIAEAGYTYVQTSPANTCYVGEGGGMALMSQEGDSVRGKWYYYYQPTDWKIGNYMLGSRDDFTSTHPAMPSLSGFCTSAIVKGFSSDPFSVIITSERLRSTSCHESP